MKKLIFSFVLLCGVVTTNSFANSYCYKRITFDFIGVTHPGECYELCSWKLLVPNYSDKKTYDFLRCLNDCIEQFGGFASHYDVM